MNKKMIIFDFDGTIADSISFIFETANILAEKAGVKKLNTEELNLLRTKSPMEIIKTLKIPLYKIPFLLRDGRRLMHEKMEKIKFVDGMEEVLIELKSRGYRLGILSSNSKENIVKFLKKHRMEIFDFVHSELNLFGKDGALTRIIKENNLNKDEVLYVGDEVRDIESCLKIGLEVVAVTWGFNSRKILQEYHPQHIIDKPEELLMI